MALFKGFGIKDVISEIPESAGTVFGAIGKTLKEIGQGITRNIVSTGVTIGKKLGGAEEISYQDFPQAFQGFTKALITEAPVKSVEDNVVSTENWLKNWATQKEQTSGSNQLTKTLKENAPLLAFVGVMGSVGLDLTPFGGLEKGATKAIIKAKNIVEATTVLKKLNVADDLITKFAPDIVKVADEKTAKKLITSIANLQKTTKAAPQAIQPLAQEVAPNRLPAVIRGETFTLGAGKATQPTIKELRTGLKTEIKATKQELKLAQIAEKKAQKLSTTAQKIREDAIANINTKHGTTEEIIKILEKRNLSPEDIDNIILEDGTKLVDTIKVKRNADKSLASVIKKSDIEDIKNSYTGKLPTEKWRKVNVFEEGAEKTANVAKLYELPQVWFERKGLNKLFEPVIEAGRGAEALKESFINRFRATGLFKNQGWFTADRFNLTDTEANNIGRYFLGRQGRGVVVPIEKLTQNEQKFVKVFDSILKDTEERFYEVAKKNGKIPNKVENYAPIMTKEDIELIDKGGPMDFIFRKHPSFFSLKERVKGAPKELYETDYRKVATRWIDGIAEFLNMGEVTPDIKYLIDSEDFQKIITQKDLGFIQKWLKDITTPQIQDTAGGEAVDFVSRLLRKGAAIASLGLNYASVVKQALTQIPISIIEKASPKLKSKFAEAFNISVKELPSLTKRKGDIAISDLQGKIGRIFTGALTEFDRKNAQISLNALLDKEYGRVLKAGAEITPEIQNLIVKKAQDTLDLWYGGFFKGQKPEAFRSSLGQFINMFIYPLTSQLNGFYRHVLQAKGEKKAIAIAEVMAAATSIAYMESAISELSFQWSDEKQMTKDVLQSLLGNIPIVSQISYAIINDQQLQVSAGISGIANLGKKITQYIGGDKELIDVGFAGAEVLGLSKQIRRVWEGIEIINNGGIIDTKGKMLAPVKTADEIVRSFLRGKYGSLAAQDWVRNLGEKTENRRWFIPEVEFLQNGDYDRKAEIYRTLNPIEQTELKAYLSPGQIKLLNAALRKKPTSKTKSTISTNQKTTSFKGLK